MLQKSSSELATNILSRFCCSSTLWQCQCQFLSFESCHCNMSAGLHEMNAVQWGAWYPKRSPANVQLSYHGTVLQQWTEEHVMCIVFFLVAHRYLGEEEDGSVSKESRSQALLAKLQQKAKEKQDQSLTEQRQQTVQQPVKKIKKADKDSNQEARRHKKRKSEEEPVEVLGSGNNDDSVKEKRKKKGANEKQKKKHQSGLFLFFYSLLDNSGMVWQYWSEQMCSEVAQTMDFWNLQLSPVFLLLMSVPDSMAFLTG